MNRAIILLATLVAASAHAQTFGSHRTYLGKVQEGQSLRVTASFVDNSPTPQPVVVDEVQCWVRMKGEDPAKVAPLYTCPVIDNPGVAAVPIDLAPLAAQLYDEDSTSTERHRVSVLGRVGSTYIPLEGEFDVVSDPGIYVDPDTGVPMPVLPPTPTPTPSS